MSPIAKTLLPTLLCLPLLATQVHGAVLQSAPKITFDDAGTLYIADWKAARVYAVHVPQASKAPAGPFNLHDVQASVARALKVKPSMVRFEDLAVQPGSNMAYVSVTLRDRAAVVAIDAGGRVREFPTSNLKTFARIGDGPAPGLRFWRDLPAPALTVTDMKTHDGKLYLAGLSNRNFASTLRVFDLPLRGAARTATVEMYHPVHNQIETRAPIRAITFAVVDGVPNMVAAYTCTPLVLIHLDAITDGAHITGQTIGEMGWGSAPVGMVSYKLGESGNEMVLLANSSRSADLMAVADIARQARLPGLHDPISVPDQPYAGIKAAMAPMAAVMRFDNLDAKLLLALRRDGPSGAMQLVSIPKGAYLRLSDFVNEYDFEDYTYPPNDTFRVLHKAGRALEGYPELAR